MQILQIPKNENRRRQDQAEFEGRDQRAVSKADIRRDAAFWLRGLIAAIRCVCIQIDTTKTVPMSAVRTKPTEVVRQIRTAC